MEENKRPPPTPAASVSAPVTPAPSMGKGGKGVGKPAHKPAAKKGGGKPSKKSGKDARNRADEKKAAVKQEKKDKRVPWGPSVNGYSFDLPIPVGSHVLAKWRGDGQYHTTKVLDLKPFTDPELCFAARNAVKAVPEGVTPHPYVYYVHYFEFNRRMDEWTTRDRLRTRRSSRTRMTRRRRRVASAHSTPLRPRTASTATLTKSR